VTSGHDRDTTFTATTFLLWSALLTWAAYFLFVYVGTALACARGLADDSRIAEFRLVPAAAGIAFVVALVVTVAFTVAAWRRRRSATAPSRRFVGFVSWALGLLALAALAWTTLPLLLLDTRCA
jgi:hypothetical protein